MQDPVRIKLKGGAVVTHERAFAESHGLTVLDDERALAADGTALADKPAESVDEAAAKKGQKS